MKALIIIIFIALSFVTTKAQSLGDSILVNNEKPVLLALSDTTQKAGTKAGQCGNLSKDSCKCMRNRGKCRQMDTFIDKDKDGMNDNRCNRMGWGNKKRMGKCCKKK